MEGAEAEGEKGEDDETQLEPDLYEVAPHCQDDRPDKKYFGENILKTPECRACQ